MDREKIIKEALNEVKEKPKRWIFVFTLKTTFWISWVVVAIYGIYIANNIFVVLSLQILLGAAFAHGVELQHQALHLSGFPSQKLSRFFGVLFGLPMLVSYSSYQDSHLFHHQMLGKPEDSEFFEYGDKEQRKFSSIINHFFLINHFRSFLKNFYDAVRGKRFTVQFLKRNSSRIRFEYLVMGIVFFGFAILSLYFNSNLFIKLWLVPLFLFAAPIHALIELPEHLNCNKNTVNVFENTRTVKTNPFLIWFTNGNNYHVEHHWLASIPPEKLASLHKKIEKNIVNLSPSYTNFYIKFFAKLLNRSAV